MQESKQNEEMIARDDTDAAVHYANKRAFIAKMAQIVADRAAKSTTKPPIAGLTRVSAQDHRVGGWGFVR